MSSPAAMPAPLPDGNAGLETLGADPAWMAAHVVMYMITDQLLASADAAAASNSAPDQASDDAEPIVAGEHDWFGAGAQTAFCTNLRAIRRPPCEPSPTHNHSGVICP